AENGVLHDDALAANLDGAALCDDLSAEHDSCARPDGDVSADGGVGSDERSGVDDGRLAQVFDEHRRDGRTTMFCAALSQTSVVLAFVGGESPVEVRPPSRFIASAPLIVINESVLLDRSVSSKRSQQFSST